MLCFFLQDDVPSHARGGRTSRCKVEQPLPFSEGESRSIPASGKATCVSVGSSSCSFRRYEKCRGHHGSGISKAGTTCSSGTSTGCTAHKMRTICCSGSEAVGCSRRGTSKIGLRGGSGAAVASRSVSETTGSEFNSASTSTKLGSGSPVPDMWKRSSRISGGRSTLSGRSGILLLQREDVLRCRTPPWPWWAWIHRVLIEWPLSSTKGS